MGNWILAPAFFGLAMMALAAFRDDLDASGRIFWAGATITTITTFFIGLPRGLGPAAGGSVCAIAAITFTAYRYTSFLNIGGKPRTFYSDHIQPYGGRVTTKKAWWQLLFAIAIFMYPVFALMTGKGGLCQTAVSAFVAIVAGVGFGYRDQLLHNPVAAGQRVQFVLVSIVTFGLFPAGYLTMYFGGQHWITKTEAYERHSRARASREQT